jgi:sugar O-acyltransferase (sialic acid O-acetyltransferase NeuD family)
MNRIAIIGNGGLARSIKARILPLPYDIFVSDDNVNASNNTNDSVVLPISKINKNIHVPLICIGWSQLRYKIYNELPKGIKLHTFIDERSHIYNIENKIGEGSIIASGSILTTGAEIGKSSIINLNSTFGHDSKAGDFFTAAPGVNISGDCKIGDRVYFAPGSVTKNGITICDDVIVGMNSVVAKNITEPGVYVGSPAVKIKNNVTICM